MNLFNITLNSLGRQKSKKTFLLIAMVLSFTTVLTLYTFTLSQTSKIENQFDEYGANIIITPKTDSLSLNYGGISFNEVVSIEEIHINDLDVIETIKDFQSLRAVSPKLVGAVNVDTGTKQMVSVIVGTDIATELKIKSWWDSEENIPEKDNEIIVGWDVADKLEINEFDVIQLNGKDFKVVKILEVSGNQDDSAIIARINVVEDLLNKKGRVSLVEVSALCSECPIEDLVSQIADVLPGANVRALREVMVQRMEVVSQVEKFALSISVILILLCSMLIFSNMASSVNERKHEIGIYRAIGFTKSNIMSIVIGESIILAIFAGIIGIILSIFVSYLGLPKVAGIDVKTIVIDELFFMKSFIVILFIGFLSSLYPSIKASNSDPVKAISSL